MIRSCKGYLVADTEAELMICKKEMICDKDFDRCLDLYRNI